MGKHEYYCTQRPAVPGAIPRGVVGIMELDKANIIQEIGKGAYSIVVYDRELTRQEMHDFELTEKRG